MAVKTENLSIGEKINDFIQKNRKLLLILLAAIIGTVIILVAVFSVRDMLVSKAFTRVDDFERRLDELMADYSEEFSDPAFSDDIFLLLDELAQFEKSNSGFAAARAYSISAAIYEAQSDWANAENAWTSAAASAAKTYFAPVAYFNAAAAAEEQGNNQRAIELYEKVLEFGIQFPAAPRAQFSIGRLYESMGDVVGAIIAYQSLVSQYPQDQIWVNLAHSRILALSIIRQY